MNWGPTKYPPVYFLPEADIVPTHKTFLIELYLGNFGEIAIKEKVKMKNK